MNRSFVSSCVAAALCAIAIAACSSGLGNNLPPNETEAGGDNANLPVGLDLGLAPTDPVTETRVAGLVVPGIGGAEPREVVLLAFTTAASAADGDGAGTPLSRDAVADGNGASDVFVAAVSARDVETRAFSQSLAGKFRHPRCTTCHSMQAPDTLAFATSPLPHAGPAPGPGFPNNDPTTCAPCHVTSNTFPVVGWQAPAASFDFRGRTVAELAAAAANVPADETEHFVTDKRVLWALDSGILPQVGGRNGVADDDHDGVAEPEDEDGVPRTVPGGSAAFLREIEEWNASGRVVTAATAVRDLTLVSRAAGGAAAGDGASAAPSLVWVPNPSFDPTDATTAAATNPIGTLFVAYQSDATDLAAGGGNGASDVFRTAVELRAEEDVDGSPLAGGLNVRAPDTTLLVSTRNGLAAPGNAASARPAIGGANGEWIVFESLASDLVSGFTDANGPTEPDVYVRLATINQTQLVSHEVGNTAIGGDGASERPAIDPTGVAVAFESDATDLIAADTNGVRDVFHARIDAGSPFTKVRSSVTATGSEGSGGPSSAASVHVTTGGRIRVAFQSDKTDLAPALVAATNVFLFDGDTGGSTLLNQRVSPNGDAIGDGPARAPVVSQDGTVVAFESDAGNIDVLRPDGNRSTDVFLVETLQIDGGNVLPYRISTTAGESAEGNGASSAPSFGSFVGSADFRVGFAAYRTAATNLGTSDTTDVVVTFLDETSGVLARFSATPVVGTVPLQVQFTDESSGTPTSWSWDFDDDGNVDSTEQNPTFTYTTPGVFTVELVARNANTEGSRTETDLVRARGPVAANFTQSTTSGALPLTVVFTDQSTEPFGAVTGWQWDFDGDGTIDSTLQNPSFDYTTQGTFSVTLTVTGEGGTATLTKTDLITVDPPGPITANFTSVRSGYNDQSIAFTDTSVGFVTSWSWDFGDGATSTLQNPSHTFATPGTYTVSLTATGPAGSDSETKPDWFTSVPASVTVTIEADKDTSIYSEATGNGNGLNPQLVCGNAATLANVQFGIRRALVEFDVAAAVPAGSTVQSASLQLTCTYNPVNPTGAESVALRRVTSEWTQGSTNSGIGGGGAATGGDATWANARSSGPVIAWTTPGGDFVAGTTQTRTVNTAGVYTWNSNATMIADVQLWLDTPAQNHGWILRANETPGQRSAKVFGSRENLTPADRPKLNVTYQPPLP